MCLCPKSPVSVAVEILTVFMHFMVGIVPSPLILIHFIFKTSPWLPPFCKWGTGGAKKLSDLPKVTQQLAKSRIQTKATGSIFLALNSSALLLPLGLCHFLLCLPLPISDRKSRSSRQEIRQVSETSGEFLRQGLWNVIPWKWACPPSKFNSVAPFLRIYCLPCLWRNVQGNVPYLHNSTKPYWELLVRGL